MRSTIFQLVLTTAACLPLLSACSPHPSTLSSIARTERPTLPALPAELVRVERLEPLASPASGQLVTIDKAALAELYDRLAQAIGAVERGNVRAGGVRRLWGCVDTILRTGATPAPCAPAR